MDYVGIDPSLTQPGLAHAIPDGKPPRGFSCSTWTLTLVDEADMDRRLAIAVRRVVDEVPLCNLVAIEGLSLASNQGSSQERAALHYMLRAKLVTREQRFIIVPPTTLKKFICATGAAKKELMLKEMFRRYGVDTDDNNQADAAALAIFGLAHDGHIPMTQIQADQMRSFKLPKVKKAKKGRAV